MHDTDNDLSELLHQATRGLQTDPNDLVERGMRKGMRMRRRRKLAVGAAAASVLVLSGAVAFAAQAIEPKPMNLNVAGSSTPDAVPTPASTPEGDPSEEALATLRGMVPSGYKVSDLEHWGDDFAAASLTVDDGKGLSELSVLVDKGSLYNDNGEVAGCEIETAKDEACVELPDGTVIVSTELAREYADGRPEDLGVKYSRVALYRPDGTAISLTTYTSRDEKLSPNTREVPPFSVEQLQTMATSPLWKPVPRSSGEPTEMPTTK